jgi:hypothetical protein
MATTAQVFGPMSPINDVLPNNAPGGFLYDVVYVPGAAQNNALRNRAEQDAALAQTQQEHNDALNAYLAAMQYPPAVRKMMGEQIEKNMAKWNPKVDKSPRRPLTPSSSAISEIKINPDNTIGIKYGPNSKSYTFRGGNTVQDAAREVLKLINSGSIGKELSKNGSWMRTHRI